MRSVSVQEAIGPLSVNIRGAVPPWKFSGGDESGLLGSKVSHYVAEAQFRRLKHFGCARRSLNKMDTYNNLLKRVSLVIISGGSGVSKCRRYYSSGRLASSNRDILSGHFEGQQEHLGLRS